MNNSWEVDNLCPISDLQQLLWGCLSPSSSQTSFSPPFFTQRPRREDNQQKWLPEEGDHHYTPSWCILISRRTVSTGFLEAPKCQRGFVGARRTQSYGQDVVKLPETLMRKQETFTSIPEEEVVEDSQAKRLCRWLESLPCLGIALNILTVLIYQVIVLCYALTSCFFSCSRVVTWSQRAWPSTPSWCSGSGT